MNPVKGQVMPLSEALSNCTDSNGKKIEFKKQEIGGGYTGQGSDGRTYMFDMPEPSVSINFIKTAVIKEDEKKKLDEAVKELDKDALEKQKETPKKIGNKK